MTTPAQHDRDLAEGRVARLKQDLRDGLATPPGDVEAMDELVATAHRLLDAELAFEEARRRLADAELESRHAATQRAVVWFAAAPVLVPLVAAALVLFEVLSPVWLLLLVPLFGAGLWVGFAPVRRAAAVIRERRRAASAGTITALALALALIPWSGAMVCTILTALGVVGTTTLLWRESRIP
ncbi:hypothetical protein [Amycolatopsis rifamycinica]|uniref:Uncharacterized protein n=1 Tax=Amycolatopsis rifamycinica TaxID=287986 RepID=A0A066U0G1_9PSEU|nr:hypothetical protein [Amycolatopsis rifamycinica]KDN20585.1 hypothetical protein DV20_19415 [Amycolatopsis rifamycinica]